MILLGYFVNSALDSYPIYHLQYVSAEGHGIASFPVQSPPPPVYPTHPHQSNAFSLGANRAAAPTAGLPQQPVAGDRCKH